MPDYVLLPGSATPSALVPGTVAGPLGDAEAVAPIEVTLLLRENPVGPSLEAALDAVSAQPPGERRHLTLDELGATHGSLPEDVVAVSEWARGAGLEVVGSEPATRRVRLRGAAAQVAAAFRVTFDVYEAAGPGGRMLSYRHHSEPASVPARFAGIIEHVSGLSTRPIASPHIKRPHPAHVQITYTPEQLAEVYGFPALPNGGAGLAIDVGVAELGGRADADVVRWFNHLHPNVQLIEDSVSGSPLPAPDPGGADVEVALDWQVVARALLVSAPKASIRIVLRYAPNTDQGFADLWNSFATDTTYRFTGVSTSWGSAEDTWTAGEMMAMDSAAKACLALGIFHCAAAGDSGATDSSPDGSLQADHPASSPNVLAAGGTRLTLSGGTATEEVVWNEVALSEGASGGGVSGQFPVPTYQASNGVSELSLATGKPGRSEPDMAANADPVTGYEVVTGVDASTKPVTQTVGGTSAVAPLLTAGFTAVAALLGARLGRIQDAVYPLGKVGTGFRDVVSGNNGYPGGTMGYSAGPGFDVPSGWGSPHFVHLADEFRAAGTGRRAHPPEG
jgi:kumamolisin